jgi:DNA-binding response OmpR family regulator
VLLASRYVIITKKISLKGVKAKAEVILMSELNSPENSNTKQATTQNFLTLETPIPAARILLVDDTPDVLELLKVYLVHEGYQVETAISGKQALEMLDEFAPDVMCVDFLMPGMDGQELARQIRARKDMLYVPIVMLTAVSGVDSVKLDSFKSGVDAFLTKPVKRDELKIIIRTMLRIKGAQDKMLAALERVAEVQDQLLQYEREKGQLEATQHVIETINYELTTPLNFAAGVAVQIQQLLDPTETAELDQATKEAEIRQYLQDLQNALAKTKDALSHISKNSISLSKEVSRKSQ